MVDYKSIKLTKNEEELLNVLLNSNYNVIDKDDMWGLRATGINGEEEKCLSLCGLSCFRWVKDDGRYEIEKLLNPPHEPKTVWDLEDGDKYWFVNPRGSIDKLRWSNTDFDVEWRNQGNAFLTEEEAEFESKRREVVTKVRKYARPYIPKKDNYFPYYDDSYKCIQISCTRDCYYSMLSFNSYGDIHKAIAEVGEEDFKKYYLGVVEQ